LKSFWDQCWDDWDHFEIILDQCWDDVRISSGSFWCQFGITWGSCLGHVGMKGFGITLGSPWDNFGISIGVSIGIMFGILFGSLWDYVWDHIGIMFWDHVWDHVRNTFGLLLGSRWDLFEIMCGVVSRIMFGSLCNLLGVMLGSPWDMCGIALGITLGSCWDHFGITFGSTLGSF
jgi:hypothetical protein